MMRSSLFFLALAIAAGCAGGETDAVSAASTAFVGQAEPLVRVEATVWNLAPAGCEGRLGDAGLRWGVAIEAPELVVAFRDGIAICVDSYSAVESELGTIDSPDLDGLWAGYVATLQELEPNVGEVAPNFGDHLEPLQAEPHPQPSLEAAPIAPRVDLGLDIDLDIARAEPHPQPSDPTEGSNGSNGGNTSNTTGTSASTGTSTSSPGTSTNTAPVGNGMQPPRDEPSRT
ncbi:MAG: hypothetical protein R3B99_12210 [Polyangiales bacterium]